MLIDDVRGILQRLAPQGWSQLLRHHGLDPEAPDLAAELGKELPGIDRNAEGFQDFAPGASRGIEPGSPARSLLYHALASPAVRQQPDGSALGDFPTVAEIETVENYVYAARAARLQDLTDEARALATRLGLTLSGDLAIVLFAQEYRPAQDAVHGVQADMAYARTGISRAGTLAPHYRPETRGFWPSSPTDGIHVIPCRWTPYISALVTTRPGALADTAGFGPMRPQRGDDRLQFWVPLHKLFDGPECLAGETLSLQWESHHENTKIARVHQFFDAMGAASHVGTADLTSAPYRLVEGIAELVLGTSDLGAAGLVPTPHNSLVEIARRADNRPLTFRVPAAASNGFGSIGLFSSSLELRSRATGRFAPEYVHIRHVVQSDGSLVSLNDDRNMMGRLRAPNFEAVHYADFTGAGYVTLRQTGLSRNLEIVPAFSIVAAPDFYPAVDQRAVADWTDRVDPALRRFIRWGAEPAPLSDTRFYPDPNITHQGAQIFDPGDSRAAGQTVSAVVTDLDAERTRAAAAAGLRSGSFERCHVLPDAAAGVFAPGWAISDDTTGNVRHLAAYGLGSPFPEDAKLCAALSAFWPAVAPDTTRTFQPRRDSIAPMTDEEIAGREPWDGIAGIGLDQQGTRVEYPAFDFADYVESAVANGFTLKVTSNVDFDEYTRRVLATAIVRRQAGDHFGLAGGAFVMASFRKLDAADSMIGEVNRQTGQRFSGDIYAFTLVVPDRERRRRNDHRRLQASVIRSIDFVTDLRAIADREFGDWQVRPFIGV